MDASIPFSACKMRIDRTKGMNECLVLAIKFNIFQSGMPTDINKFIKQHLFHKSRAQSNADKHEHGSLKKSTSLSASISFALSICGKCDRM